MTFLVYIVLYTCSIFLAASAAKCSIKMDNNVWNHPSFYGLLIVFSFIVGTRYMVGLDYPAYMNMVKLGELHNYYDSIEFIPRKIIDFVNALNLDFYWWFILMAFFQILFLAIAVRDSLIKLFPWIIFCFLVLYLGLCMNVVRQGVALSCFLCAVTYAIERRFWPYLLFILIGFLFHRSIIVWFPIYWMLNKELFPKIIVQYVLLFLSAFIIPAIIEKIIDVTSSYWVLFGYTYQSENFIGTEEAEKLLGSGLGVILRYIRWGIIIAYYNKLKFFYGNNLFILFYNLFFIGICLDYSSMLNVNLSRLFVYGSFVELIILPYLLFYLSKSKIKVDKIVLASLLVLLIAFPIYSIISGSIEWEFVWNRLFF